MVPAQEVSEEQNNWPLLLLASQVETVRVCRCEGGGCEGVWVSGCENVTEFNGYL